MRVGTEPRVRDFADALDFLFKTVRPANGGQYGYQAVSSAIASRGGPTISGSYVWQLRTGQRHNPTLRQIVALSEFFGVPPSYFFDSDMATRVDAELAMLTVMRNPDIRRLAVRSRGLPAEDLAAVLSVIERLRSARGLDDPRGGEPIAASCKDTTPTEAASPAMISGLNPGRPG